MDVQEMIIDLRMPAYDVTIAKHQIVDADVPATWTAARNLDLMGVHTPLLDAAMWARSVPARLRGRPVSRPPRLVLAEGDRLPGWLPLGEHENFEVAFGAVGRFWQANIDWRDVPLDEFTTFAEPGFGKIACAFSVRPYGGERSLLSYECRTATTDPASRRRFARYWAVIQPFVAHVMRATVIAIGADAARRSRQRQGSWAG